MHAFNNEETIPGLPLAMVETPAAADAIEVEVVAPVSRGTEKVLERARGSLVQALNEYGWWHRGLDVGRVALAREFRESVALMFELRHGKEVIDIEVYEVDRFTGHARVRSADKMDLLRAVRQALRDQHGAAAKLKVVGITEDLAHVVFESSHHVGLPDLYVVSARHPYDVVSVVRAN